MDPFLIRLLIAVFSYFFFNIIIDKFVKNPDAKNVFEYILLFGCIFFLIFGAFLPIRFG